MKGKFLALFLLVGCSTTGTTTTETTPTNKLTKGVCTKLTETERATIADQNQRNAAEWVRYRVEDVGTTFYTVSVNYFGQTVDVIAAPFDTFETKTVVANCEVTSASPIPVN